MAGSVSLGILWGTNSFSVVESHQDAPQKIFRVLHQPIPEFDPISPISNADDVQYVNPLKTALNAHGINAVDVNLALPSKDIVIRSFVIPQVKPNEINGVVEFEVKRYIPFNLKDLAFTYQAIKFVEDNNKLMRIHFVAIRREILERYKYILRGAGLNVVYSEPIPMSLTRILTYRKLIRTDQKVAVILTDLTDPGIIIIDKGIVHFVRDFQLQHSTLNLAPLDVEMLRKKLFNEVKISIDFYMRQFKSENIGEVYAVSLSSGEDLTEMLQKELEIPVKSINPQGIGRFPETPDAGFVCAHAVNLRTLVKGVEFNLSGLPPAANQPVRIQDQIPEELLPVVKVGLVCLAFLISVSLLAKSNVTNMKKKYEAQVEVQGVFVDMTLDEIQLKISNNKKRLEKYQDAFRKSELAYMMTYIAKNLPKGVWLSDFDLKYDRENKVLPSVQSTEPGVEADSFTNSLIASMSGFSYAEDSNEQFKMIYGLVNFLKSDKVLMKYWRNVSLAEIQSEENENNVVTSFKIQIR